MEAFLGQIQLFPYDFEPEGWAPCKGQLLPIYANTALFSLLATRFGGDGVNSFGIPDLRGKEPTPGTHYCIALVGIYPSRA